MGQRIQMSTEAKYLGMIIDKDLNWNAHIRYVTENASRSIRLSNALIGKTWGLKPSMALWAYETMVILKMTYGSQIWWKKTEKVTVRNCLTKL